ncbi:YhgE/Pip domain-containing protein [Leucobacter allii]|uniref:YhgE/Pip domain-containing protein n=1 Tax=Leucobacter allii TaxID=2932247 RepID=A0ABY4FJ90_9MICO|nr:YhgE/Pip domain-containing protein [Leucobacter allii]UOQ56766.1 YhgE/Pip domain-containing protein [Leucobacter allii]
MKIAQIVTAEFRRLLSSKMSVLALVALVCVPILYGGLYLWANQDPYGKLSQVPVALVVEDDGATVSGSARNIGEEVAEQLLDSDTFDWHAVDRGAAEAGLDDGGYDFAVEIPSDFTEAIASIQGDEPRAADIVLLTNDANNYLASTIGKQAVERIRTTVTETVVHEAGLTMLDALNTIRLSLVDAADGAAQLHDGLGDAVDGSGELADGATRLADGTAEIHEGAARLSAGSVSIHDGAARLADGNAQLASGLTELSGGAEQLRGGTAQIAAVADAVDDAVQGAAGQLPTLREDLRAALAERGLSEAEISEVLARLDPVAATLIDAAGRVQGARAQIEQLDAGAGQLVDGATQLSAGAQTAASGASELSAATATADSGAAELDAATGTAATGAATLRDGIGTLAAGLESAESGAAELASGLADGAAELPDADADTRQAQAETLGAPVEVRSDAVTQAQNYGAGLAPFFAALAAWIGIYALFLIVKPISKRAVTALNAPVRVTLAGWATPALLGGLQMLGLFGVLAITLGFQFANPLATFGLLVCASATYSAIILALNVWLGSVGQFIGLVLMVLQLVTAGGTFPWQTLPAPLAALHHVLPMGYVVDAMRQVMYGGAGWDRVGGDVAVIALWLVAALAAAMAGVARQTRRRTLRDLQPSLIG